MSRTGKVLTLVLLVIANGWAFPHQLVYIGAQTSADPKLEDVYVFRTILTRRVTGSEAIAYCGSRVTFTTLTNSYLDLVSVGTRAADGLVTDGQLKIIGKLATCTGPTTNPNVLNFYGEGEIGGVRFKGDGECTRYENPPTGAVTSLSCYNRAAVLTEGYSGGLLISNTIGPPEFPAGGVVPAGYLATSVAVARFWRKPS
jgi:hypothetical protein